MIKVNFILACLSALAWFYGVKALSEISYEEKFALTRDGFARNHPDELFNGFFAAWPFVLLILGAVFAIIAVISFVGYLLGCRNKGEYED